MKTRQDLTNATTDEVSYWRRRSERQKLLISSILSLLSKYGTSLDLRSLEREFLLTLMGQYAVIDACFFSADDHSNELAPMHSYGALRLQRLPSIGLDSSIVAFLNQNKMPHRIDALPHQFLEESFLEMLGDRARIIGPVCLKDKTLGVVMLGRKASGKRFSDFELELLSTLCAASATTFNNARLYENAKFSMKEVQRLSDLRRDMMNRISHEFRTPLTAIKGGLDFIKDSGNPEPVWDALTKSVERLHDLIDSLLVLNDRYHTDLSSNTERFNPAQQVYELISKQNQTLSAKELNVEVKENADLGSSLLKISRTDFVTVADLLLQNAAKYSRNGSTIHVEVDRLSREPDEDQDGAIIIDWKTQTQRTISAYRKFYNNADSEPGSSASVAEDVFAGNLGRFYDESYVVLRVSDSGIGIPEDELRFLGEPFRQASNSPDQYAKGKALGLAVVQKIISDCRGHLCCKSKEGVGTTFSVFVPLVHP